MRNAPRTGILATIFTFALACSAWAIDIEGVQPAALDQPRINAYLSLTEDGQPLTADFGGGFTTFNIQAFFDTGASGVLLSNNTADLLGVNRQTVNGDPEIFTDVGAVGTANFNISETLYASLAPFHPDEDLDNPGTFAAVYDQSFGPIRTQIGPVGVAPDPVLGDLDIFGVPTMKGHVVVMDPKPVNTFLDTMRTYVYDPGTPFNAGSADRDPGIPATSRHVALDYADFASFTTTTPGAAPPTLEANPFIGPNPLLASEGLADLTTPGVKIGYDGAFTEGSWLLDTGAAASIISESQAAAVGVTYDPNSVGTDDPILQGVPLADQFQLTVGGIGGTQKIAGFFLDSMLVRTEEGDATNDADPNHFNFVRAPVLVADITLEDDNEQTITLDGIFGMNYLVASAFITEASPFPIISDLTFGAFDWITFDYDAGLLGLELGDLPSQVTLRWLGGQDGDNDWDIQNKRNWGVSLFPDEVYVEGDFVEFSDFIATNAATNVDIVVPVAPGNVVVSNTDTAFGVPVYTFNGAAIQGQTGLEKTGSGTLVLNNANTYTGTTDVQAGVIVMNGQQDIGDIGIRSGGRVVMNNSQRFDALTLAGGDATLSGGGDKVLVVESVDASDGGTLDLTDNAMIVTDDTLPDVAALIAQGRNGGDWTGDGVTSSTAVANPVNRALGIADNGVLGLATFAGQAVDGDDLLIRLTLPGDANLDGIVNVTDLGILASNWQQTGRFWFQADFNYDGMVNVTDLGALASNWQSTLPLGIAAARFGVAVPEPSMLALCASLFATIRGSRRVDPA